MGKIKPARTTPAQKRNSVVRWIFYFVVIVLCTAFQNAGDYVKPLLLIPVALCIASNVKQGQRFSSGFSAVSCWISAVTA